MPRFKVVSVAAVASAMLATGAARAQEHQHQHQHHAEHKHGGEDRGKTAEHAHGSPHGGLVKTLGNGHAEVMIKDGRLLVWVLDAKEKTVPPPSGGKAVLQVGKNKHELALAGHGDHLMAALSKEAGEHIAAANGKVAVLVTLAVDGKPRSTRFGLSPGARAAAKDGASSRNSP